jgi:diguanylate cyclase (GGDEF)-like protein/PAS domain S-box-containing protein
MLNRSSELEGAPHHAPAPDQAGEPFWRSVLDSLSARICVLDERGFIVAVNQAWRRFHDENGGAPGAAHEGINYLDVCERAASTSAAGSVDATAFGPLLADVLAGRRERFEYEYECHSPTEQRWFIARVARIEGAEPRRVVVAHKDITSPGLVREQLREREALLVDLTASIPGAVFRLLGSSRNEQTFLFVSQGIEALCGLSPAVLCRDARALWNLIDPRDRDAHACALRTAFDDASPWEQEFRIRTPGGVVKWIHASATPKPAEGEGVVWTGLLTDVSAKKAVDDRLAASESTYRTLFETVPQGVVYQDAGGRITSANPAAIRILGLTLDQMQGRTSIDPRWRSVREDGTDFPGEEHPSMVALRTGEPVRNVVMGVRRPDDTYVWILINAIPLHGEDGALEQVYASFEDITQRVALEQELKRQASTDFLTGAVNRRGLMARLETEFRRTRRLLASSCAVLALDLDHFKHINDTFGHAAGDIVLRHLAGRVQACIRDTDLLARTGGEEFAVLLPDTPVAAAAQLAERLRQDVERAEIAFEGHVLRITVSIGLAVIEPGDAGIDAVLSRADQALYRAKDGGRNRVMA